jgi:hypothetical protein
MAAGFGVTVRVQDEQGRGGWQGGPGGISDFVRQAQCAGSNRTQLDRSADVGEGGEVGGVGVGRRRHSVSSEAVRKYGRSVELFGEGLIKEEKKSENEDGGQLRAAYQRVLSVEGVLVQMYAGLVEAQGEGKAGGGNNGTRRCGVGGAVCVVWEADSVGRIVERSVTSGVCLFGEVKVNMGQLL